AYFFDNSGTPSVGIGTSTPVATLQVSGTLAVSTSAQTTTPSLYVASNGYVGVGTSSPAYSFDVNGIANSNLAFRVMKDGSNSIGSGADLFLLNTAATRGWAQQLSASNNLDFWYYDGSVWDRKVTFQSSTGNVGINTTAPTATLQVSGT